MISRMLAASLTTFVLFLPGHTISQQVGDVTFTMPLNLTNLSPDIGKVQVTCTITSPAIPSSQGGNPRLSGRRLIVVSGGQVVMTATVVVTVTSLTNPIGQNATYGCTLSGWSTSLQTWGVFDPAATTPAFRLSPAPVALTGSFAW